MASENEPSAEDEVPDDELLPEYSLNGGVRGRYAARPAPVDTAWGADRPGREAASADASGTGAGEPDQP